MKDYLNTVFQNFLIPMKSKPTSVSKSNGTALDHILTNSLLNSHSKELYKRFNDCESNIK